MPPAETWVSSVILVFPLSTSVGVLAEVIIELVLSVSTIEGDMGTLWREGVREPPGVVAAD